MSATPSPTQTSAPSGNNTNKKYTNKKLDYADYEALYMSGAATKSRGINVTQLVIAGLEDYILHGDMKSALIMAGSVGVSNLVSGNGPLIYNAVVEKFVAEPVVAGALNALAGNYMGRKNPMKRFTEGFIIGSSSAGLNMAALKFTDYGPPFPESNFYNIARTNAYLQDDAYNANFFLA